MALKRLACRCQWELAAYKSMDAASLELAIRECKDHGLDRLTFAPDGRQNYLMGRPSDLEIPSKLQAVMGSNHRNQKGEKKAKHKTVEAKPPAVLVGKFEDIFTRIGAIGAGIAFVIGILVWLVVHPVWAYWVALIAVPVCVAFAAGRFPRFQLVARILWVLVASASSFLVGTLFPPNQKEQNGVSIKMGPYFMRPRSEPPEFWLEGKDSVFAAHIALYVRLVHSKSNAIMIEDYQVETEVEKGNWKPIYKLDPTIVGAVYGAAPNVSRAVPLTFIGGGGDFNTAIRGRRIEPGTPVRGWIFLEAPRFTYTDRMRIRLTLTDDSTLVQEIGYIRRVRNTQTPNDAIQFQGFQIGEPRDFSRSKQTFFHEP